MLRLLCCVTRDVKCHFPCWLRTVFGDRKTVFVVRSAQIRIKMRMFLVGMKVASSPDSCAPYGVSNCLAGERLSNLGFVYFLNVYAV